MKTAFLSVLMTTGSSLWLQGVPAVIAHRGASADAPENTMAAFREGWNQKADGIELDIRLTKDGKIVVMHDDSTKRTAGKDLLVKSSVLDSLRKLDAGVWKGDKWKGEPVPLLEEVLKELPPGKLVFIEIKSAPEILPELARVIKASAKPAEQLRIIAFDFDTLVKSRNQIPSVKTLWIVGEKKDRLTGKREYPDLTKLAEKAAAAGMDGLNLNQGFPLDKESITAIKAKGLSVAVWTVNDPAVAKSLATAGIDAISTDHPAKVLAGLNP